MSKRKKRIGIGASVIVVLITVAIISMGFMFRKNDKQVRKYFKERSVNVDIRYFKHGKQQIRYIVTGKSQNALVLFIHGAPGSSQDFYQYLADSSLVDQCTMISVDRPGYGYSNAGETVTSIRKQGAMIAPVLDTSGHYDKTILVGHSYGGSVCASIAMMYPDLVDEMLLLAPALDPENEKKVLVAYPASWPPIKWIIPWGFRVAAEEKVSHVAALNELLPYWPQIQAQVVHMHGKKDMIVPYENIAFSQQHLDGSQLKTITLPKENHFLPWSRTEEVKEELIKMIID